MKKTRKIISVLLSILMIITSVPLMAVESFAADVVQSGTTGECTWSLDSDGVLTISGNGKMKEYRPDVPLWGTSITKVVIEDGVTNIGGCAFQGCTSLENVTIPNSVTSIGYEAFRGCTSLTSVNIPDGVTSIHNGAFSGCKSLTSITIPDSVTDIGNYAFENCTLLTSITIGNGVTSIGSSTFSGCTSLTNIIIPDSVMEIDISAFENTAYYNNESNWENSLLYIGNHLIKAKEDVSGNFEIKQGTKTIAGYAFENCTSLTSITIPDSVTSIDAGAFSGCTSLTSVTIGNGVTSIGWYAFCDCTSLTSVTIGNGVTEIGELAFGYYYDSIKETFKTVDGFTVYGNRGSEAERYANGNGFDFLSAESAPSKFFPDVIRGDWYFNAVNFNAEKGYITGYSNGTFGPANNIQRQDFALILARIAGADLSAYEGKNGGFSDVPTNAYYSAAVAWAKDKGIVTGYSADNFGVGTYISREQICVIFSRYLNGSASYDVDTIINSYSDGGNTSPWAKAGVAWAVENDIIGNAGYINPTGNAGRAEVAQIIYNMANNGMI